MKSKPEDYQYELNTTTGYGIVVYLECWKDDSYYYLRMEGVGEDSTYTHTFKTKLYELDENEVLIESLIDYFLTDMESIGERWYYQELEGENYEEDN